MDFIIDLIRRLLGPVAWAFNWVLDRIRQGFEAVISWVQDGFNLIGWVTTALSNELRSLIDAARNLAHSLIDDLQRWVGWLVDQVRDWVGAVVQEARNFATGLFNSLKDYANGLASRIWDDLRGLAADVWNNGIHPLVARVEGFASWVTDHLVAMIRGWVDAAEDWARKAVDWLLGELGKARDWIMGQLQPYIDVITGAWDWLVFIARHPLSWFHDTVFDLLNRGRAQVMGAVVGAFQTHGGMVEDWIARWIG